MDITTDEPILVIGGRAGVKVTFVRLPWERLVESRHERRYVVAPIQASHRVLVATPEQFRSIVMRGPRSNYMETPSWLGRSQWAIQDGRGGVYMQPFRGAAKFRPLLKTRDAFLDSVGPTAVVIENVGYTPKVRYHRITAGELRERLI